MKKRIICYCADITDEEIKKAVMSGAYTIKDVRKFLLKFESGDCKNSNPSGKCCHGLFSQIINLNIGEIKIILK